MYRAWQTWCLSQQCNHDVFPVLHLYLASLVLRFFTPLSLWGHLPQCPTPGFSRSWDSASDDAGASLCLLVNRLLPHLPEAQRALDLFLNLHFISTLGCFVFPPYVMCHGSCEFCSACCAGSSALLPVVLSQPCPMVISTLKEAPVHCPITLPSM